MRLNLHIDIINRCFKNIENLGGLVLFLVCLCKMCYVTDYLQIGFLLILLLKNIAESVEFIF